MNLHNKYLEKLKEHLFLCFLNNIEYRVDIYTEYF